MRIYNRITNETFETDRKKARVRRMQKRVKAWCTAIDDLLADFVHYRLVMVTLTYSPDHDWKPLQISEFLKTCRDNLKDDLVGYAWVAELQSRGAVHYHVLLLTRRKAQIPRPDEAGWWRYGSTKIETARSPYYVLRYTGKEYQKMVSNFPKGMRMFAIWVAPGVLKPGAYWFLRLTALPGWLSGQIFERPDFHFQKAKRVPGGGWIVGDRWRLSSPFVAQFFRRRVGPGGQVQTGWA
jgi:hypothetical protein